MGHGWSARVHAGGDQVVPKVIADGAGGAIMAWQDYRPGGAGIYAQRIDASGLAQWDANGVALCTATPVYEPTIVSDGAGGAIVAWTDGRHGDYEEDIYAQRVSAAGVPQWTSNGVPVCAAAGRQERPTMASAGAAGVIVTWNDIRGSAFVQLVSPDSVTQWTPDGVALGPATNGSSSSTIVSDGLGGAIVAWKNSDGIFAGRVSATGIPRWSQNGVALCTTGTFKYRLVSAPDGAGGAIIAWTDDRYYTTGGMDIYAARVDSAGISQWDPSGVAICAAGGDQDPPSIASDGEGGAIVTWWDERARTYAQRVSAAGVPQWDADGAMVSTRLGCDSEVVSYEGSAIVVMRGAGSAQFSDGIYAVRVSPGIPTAISLVMLSAETEAGHVRISWYAPDARDLLLTVHRRTAESDWVDVGLPSVDINDRIVFEDSNVTPGARYGYRLLVQDRGQQEFSSEVWVLVPEEAGAPNVVRLEPIYPNPFGDRTQLTYGVPRAGQVRLSVYDLQGRRIATVVNEVQAAGWRSVFWDGRDGRGREVASGAYFARLESGGNVRVRKIVIAR